MICEPNLNLPQQINLDSIKKSHKTTVDVKENPTNSINVNHSVSYEQRDYNILPLFKDQFDYLNYILSIHSNNYLACRWNTFLDNVPENYVRISLYMDFKKSLENRVVRRKLLNGHFYGTDNKLTPIPHLIDARSFLKKSSV